MQKQNLCQGDFMPKNRQHYRKIKYPDKVTKQNALYLSGYFCLVLWEVEMLISRQPLIVYELKYLQLFSTCKCSTTYIQCMSITYDILCITMEACHITVSS